MMENSSEDVGDCSKKDSENPVNFHSWDYVLFCFTTQCDLKEIRKAKSNIH